MMLGFVLAWFAIDLSHQNTKAFAPITAVWILGIPILDTVCLMLRRILKGTSPFAPDHGHLHHFFNRAGFTVSQTAILIISLSLALGLLGIGTWAWNIPEYVMFYSFIVLSIAYFFGSLHAGKIMKHAKFYRQKPH